eukprot:TRINITY_DN47485_c0_g1_i1.p1 TRINITY_DN47485_c0_g1~~TRINITY_DN47485_c0_g1_i1.p1  ORF type:complete len:155 (-),score=27.64 TRINITY_DN47485_c0_g1_i1:39-503(-)
MELESLTEQQHKEFIFQFLLFDKDCDDYITTSELGTLIRSLGKYPTNSEVANLIEIVDGDKSGLVSKEDFLKLMATQVAAAKQDTEEDVRDAFRVFEKTPDTFISASELRHILTDLGEQITDEQADELLKDADIDGDGQINYEELIHKLMGDYL